MRHWQCWDAVNCLNQSKLTKSWCEKWPRANANFDPLLTEKHVEATILEPICQSPPSPTIHYTYNEKLEGLRCCDIQWWIQKYSILVWNVGYWSQNSHHPQVKSRGVVMVMWMMNSNLNLAKPFIILTMRHWQCWDAVNCLNQSKLTKSWCEKWPRANANFDPLLTEKHVEATILEPICQSPPSPTIHYTYNEKLEGLRYYEIQW